MGRVGIGAAVARPEGTLPSFLSFFFIVKDESSVGEIEIHLCATEKKMIPGNHVGDCHVKCCF